MSTHTFLLEIGCEELPAKSIAGLIDALASGLRAELDKASLPFDTIHPLATPRRLALKVTGLPEKQADRTEARRGPAVQAAFDQAGNPTKAAEGFARSCQTTVDKLDRFKTDKGEWLSFDLSIQGQTTVSVLPDMLARVIKRLPIPKPMRWGSQALAFARPVHWVVMMFDKNIIEANLLGKPTGNTTYGHRFHHPEAITLNDAKDYEKTLEKAFVIVDHVRREALIREQIGALTVQKQAQANLPASLLAEVTQLVEWPIAVWVDFDARFLSLPREVLMAAMQQHQKCFSLHNADQSLQPAFITISNIESQDPAKVVEGNARVMYARLEDAVFFYDSDRKHSLADWAVRLNSVVFQKQLGTLQDKTDRITALMATFVKALSLSNTEAKQAAALCKADLMTNMVEEFPEVQGTMGYYLAAHEKLPNAVAIAIKEHYLPRFSQDTLPETPLGLALALADRLDTLVGIFAIGKHPTGDKDPFALRRAAIGVLRMIIENQLDLPLKPLVEQAVKALPPALQQPSVATDVLAFFHDRVKAFYQEQGVETNILHAVLACADGDLWDIHQRIQAVSAFVQLPEADSLAAANKRVSNLLAKQPEAIVETTVDHTLLTDDAEKTLAKALLEQQNTLGALLTQKDYTGLLTALTGLKPAVDAFFDAVMIMADDLAVRQNRLRLLYQLQQLFLHVADIAKLQR